MTCSTISRVRMHDLNSLGRSGLMEAGEAGFREACASPRRRLPSTSSIEEAPPRHPRQPSSRPEADDLMEQVI